MKTWKQVHTDWLKNPEYAREYDKLGPQFELASQLIELRLKRGLTQAQLAKKAGTQQSAIARLESGTANPSLQILQRIAQATESKFTLKITDL